MQFDLTSFLAEILKVFRQCQKDGEIDAPTQLIENRPLVRLVAMRALRKQAKAQGAKRRDRRSFATQHINEAVVGLKNAVREIYPS